MHEVADAKELTKDELLSRVRLLITESANILRSISAEHARLGWMLEDALAYLDEVDFSDSGIDMACDCLCEDGAPLKKTANTNAG